MKSFILKVPYLGEKLLACNNLWDFPLSGLNGKGRLTRLFINDDSIGDNWIYSEDLWATTSVSNEVA